MSTNRISVFVFVSCLFVCYSGSAQLINPLDGGYIIETPPIPVRHHGPIHTITIYPTNNFQVQAAEAGKVISVFELDGIYVILTKSQKKKHYAVYTGLDTCYVQKDSLVKQGQLLGKLNEKDNTGLDFVLSDSTGREIPPNIQVPIRKPK